MNTQSFRKEEEAKEVKVSRLPAGSTLMLPNGIHVPHPHAEPNLPGAGDPRMGNTHAVTEQTLTDQYGNAVTSTTPLRDEVKAKVTAVASVKSEVLPGN